MWAGTRSQPQRPGARMRRRRTLGIRVRSMRRVAQKSKDPGSGVDRGRLQSTAGLRRDPAHRSRHTPIGLANLRTIELANPALSRDRGDLIGNQTRGLCLKIETAGLTSKLISIHLQPLSSQMSPYNPHTHEVSTTALDLGAVLADDHIALTLRMTREDDLREVTGTMATGTVQGQRLQS